MDPAACVVHRRRRRYSAGPAFDLCRRDGGRRGLSPGTGLAARKPGRRPDPIQSAGGRPCRARAAVCASARRAGPSRAAPIRRYARTRGSAPRGERSEAGEPPVPAGIEIASTNPIPVWPLRRPPQQAVAVESHDDLFARHVNLTAVFHTEHGARAFSRRLWGAFPGHRSSPSGPMS